MRAEDLNLRLEENIVCYKSGCADGDEDRAQDLTFLGVRGSILGEMT